MNKQFDRYVREHTDFTNKYAPDSSIGNQSSHRYDDIINLPHPSSTSHPRMPLQDRAAQFAPFAALTGHGAAIQSTAEAVEEEMQLGKDVTLLEDPADPALWAVSFPESDKTNE